jgi:hypothetical protein
MQLRKSTDYCVLIERVRTLDNLPIWEIRQKVFDGSIYGYTGIVSMRKGRKKLLNLVLVATGEREFGGTIDMDVLKLIRSGRLSDAKTLSLRAFSFWIHVLEDKGIVDTRLGFIDEKMIDMIIKKKRVLRRAELEAISAAGGSFTRAGVRFASMRR